MPPVSNRLDATSVIRWEYGTDATTGIAPLAATSPFLFTRTGRL
ncbi:hypothetical protein RMSM_03898 [Rhodopirellula maiorica SM1]|uniref:Uncharacterized protein n=1 Tax=Rhodopirellula maiorica SM1 TaxID=1265738 RepID=M5RIP3_9BACT|nr:hypothetical protein RMSM_03898 [Rhodopirellula maiorica SM1]